MGRRRDAAGVDRLSAYGRSAACRSALAPHPGDVAMTASVADAPLADTLIRASAGTGKTFQLSNRYLGLLAAGAEPEEVLATTFTRKAAAEILDRALFRLARAAGDPRECAQLAS